MLSVLLLGFVLGMRHATDADHVVAVSAIASRERSVRSALLVGVSWGLGHAVTVLVVGGAIVVLGIVIPPRVGLGMELSVAFVLIALGLVNVWGTLKEIRRVAHAHVSAPTDEPTRSVPAGLLRSVGVGVVHGLAGSAAVALLVLASIRDARLAVLYLLVFGAGTILGMLALTSALALPVAFAAERFGKVHRALASTAGFVSIALGLVLAYRIGFVDGLFTSAAPVWSPH